jgi:hypothetical protein
MTSIKRSTTLSLACGALLALALGSVAFATHGRPGGGTPFTVPLVVAYNACGTLSPEEAANADPAAMAINSTHVPPLSNASCIHATQAGGVSITKSSTLGFTTTGTGSGKVQLIVRCEPPAPASEAPPCGTTAGENEDVRISASGVTGVTCKVAGGGAPPTFDGVCTAVGAGYSGFLQAQSVIRITDHSNPTACAVGSGAGCGTGTVSDLTFSVPMICGTFAALPAGTCAPAVSTINTGLAGAVKELQRGNVEILNIRIKDPGTDFSLGGAPYNGTGDEKKFLTQGIFLP